MAGGSPVWGKGGFDEEVKRILGRWVMGGQVWASTSVRSPATVGGQLPSDIIGGQHNSKVGLPQASSTAGNVPSTLTPGTPTTMMGPPHGGTSSPGPRGLGNSIVIEEEEEEHPHYLASSTSGFSALSGSTSNWSVLSSNVSTGTGSSAFTTPDISVAQGLSSMALSGSGSPNPSLGSLVTNGNGHGQTPQSTTPNAGANASATPNPTPLTPVVALQTAESEAQMGLAKVAESDVDAFLTYAALVPELCRLEGMLIKGVV
ncbi:hypothetical protein V5O48_012425 [Marasmius crinis-equi]|uniref:Uncharacterized protein n=1 Tax=Marasmius crinis-equi TaxID=585013 RepID=A0ABR3F355_9AGAR